ncbi:Serine/threonine-protein phosphatase bsl1 [Lathyrus oleraceus]|uniref:Serine/threonine-protein phosphatase n=1 Tax=Pisum sativum TaxID=3888 RepID=A0A9D4WD35_PEA|nr:Serine/threonine-protein phosphatase bsl1 [Pisum sativum]
MWISTCTSSEWFVASALYNMSKNVSIQKPFVEMFTFIVICSKTCRIEYPDNVHLIRGNHEAADINALFGFRIECIERMGENDGIWAWTRFNQLFNHLPLAALIEKKIICMHGGIGRSIHSVEQIEKIERPITMDAGSIILMDLLWSDPTENDSVEGLRPNARGPGLVTFGPDRVTEFCKKNKLQLIIRAHECVMDGFERFAQGQLITLFSATNYCGTANNAGAILVVGRGLVVVPKLIHPIPPPLQSPESSPERVMDETWMQELNIQRPPTPTRGRPQPDLDRGSLAVFGSKERFILKSTFLSNLMQEISSARLALLGLCCMAQVTLDVMLGLVYNMCAAHVGHGLHKLMGCSDLFLAYLFKLSSWHEGIEDHVQMAKSKSRWNWKMGLGLGLDI